MKRSSTLAMLPLAALCAGFAHGADLTDRHTYFDTDNFDNDRFGWYDEDFVWSTDDSWYNDWNDPDTLAWNNPGETQWGVFGYDDADEWGVFDW